MSLYKQLLELQDTRDELLKKPKSTSLIESCDLVYAYLETLSSIVHVQGKIILQQNEVLEAETKLKLSA